MKAVIVVLLALVCVALGTPNAHEPNFKRFLQWMKQNGHQYKIDEIDSRFDNYLGAIERTREKSINARAVEWGLTPFSAYTAEEFSSYSCGLSKMTESVVPEGVTIPIESLPSSAAALPKSWDWTRHGFSNPIKQQGDCASCGVFAAVGAIEGALSSKQNVRISLSEQQLISCNPSSQGCVGTWPSLAYKSTLEAPVNGIINSENSYECESCFFWKLEKKSQCKFNPEDKAATIKGFSQFCNIGTEQCNEENMAAYLYNNGPMSVCFNNKMLQDYVSGVINPFEGQCSAEEINHCATLVGYGEENGMKYWKIRNSWGQKFGEQGYVRIARGKNACGINQVVSAPKF